jgi:diguanylate cyclase (GGDEF)-like protein
MKSIRTKGLLFSFIVILMAVSVMGFSSYIRFEQILQKEVNHAVERVAKESASHLTTYLNHFVSNLVSISEDERIKSMSWEKQAEVIKSQINENYKNIAVVDRNGMAHYTDGTLLDLHDRDYIIEALSGKFAYSEIIISRKIDKPVIMAATPIVKDGKVYGALIARLDVDFLADYALTRGYGKNGRAYIISKKGSIISSPEQERTPESYNIYDIVKTNATYQSLKDFVVNNQDTPEGYGSYEFNEQSMLMGFASIENTDWKIYISTPEKEALSSLGSVRDIMLSLIFITLGICLLAAYLFVRRFTDQIEELDDLMSIGAKGDLTIRFVTKRKDEIGRLGLSFNRMMDKIKSLTQYDPLTSLLNQYVLEKEIITLSHSEDKKDFSLIMVAIDKFSTVNETYGYMTGDLILCEVARRILINVNENYSVYRYKGDEFVILANGTVGESEVEAKANSLMSELKEGYMLQGKSIDIQFSIGIFIWKNNIRLEEPLKAVTHAKNYARYLGSNQIQIFDQEIYDKLSTMMELQADILSGIREDQFYLVYQPLFYLGSEKIAEVEALIRWKHPTKGLLYPDQFIDIAENAGTIIDIDCWVIDTACRQLMSWRDHQFEPVRLSINISAKTFEMKKFVPVLLDIVNKYKVDPSQLQLEITERILIRNVEDSIMKLQNLRSMGFRVAIDDFGIGYSSLSYIVRLPIDCIKIDKSFIRNIAVSKEAKTIVATIINLCKALNLHVIAEGIENSMELEYLKFSDCDIGQGYYFSKPISMEELEERHLERRYY